MLSGANGSPETLRGSPLRTSVHRRASALICRRARSQASRRYSPDAISMILLDTNVEFEQRFKSPHLTAQAFAAGCPAEALSFSAAGGPELRYGASIQPTDHCRNTLFSDIEALLQDAFGDEIPPLNSERASFYADMAAMRRSLGRPVAPIDC